MKKPYITALLVLFALPLHAGPLRVVTAYPRLLGRTARNMVTFHDKFAAIEEWSQLGMAAYDGWTTNRDINHHRPGFDPTEEMPLFGKRPGAARIFGQGALFAFQEAAFTQTTHEHIDGGNSQAWNVIPLGVSSLHVLHGVLNQHICDRICK